MQVLERKRQQRQKEFEAIGKELLIKKGLAGLTIEGLAKASGYSRPTVYTHFNTKSAILNAVARRTLHRIAQLGIAAASNTEGSPRERALACVLAYEMLARFHTSDFHLLDYFGYQWVLEGLPEDLRSQYDQAVTGFSRQLRSQVQAAVDNGELELRGGATVAGMTFHSIALVYGSFSGIVKNHMMFQLAETAKAWSSAREGLNAFWDGVGWSPSRSEIDYNVRAEQILKESFPDYWLKIKTEELEREIASSF